jgi:ABC-2 type transport system permease protein
MSRTITIAQRELSSMFRVPAGWIIVALFAFLTAVLFVNQTLIPGQPGSLRYFFAYAGWLLIPIAPAISMRLMSEEYRSGSIEALRTAPAGDWSVTLGKYFGSVAFLVLMLVPTLVYPLVLFLVSDPSPDWGPIGAGYLMLLLVGMLYLAIGMLASSLTASQTLAFLGTVMSLILLMVLTTVIAEQVSVGLGRLLRTLSIPARVNELSKGVIDTATIAFFLVGSVWMLVLGAGALEIRRLGRSRGYTILTTLIFVLATGAAAGFTGYIAQVQHARIDVTASGAHKLSPRAERIVERLTDPTEIVLAISRTNTNDPRTLDLVTDVLEAYDQSNPLINVRLIELDGAEGIADTRALLRDLTKRERDTIDANLSALTQAAQLMNQTTPQLGVLSEGLGAVRDAIPATTPTNTNNRAVFEQRAALMRIAARDLGNQSEQILAQLAPFTNGEASEDEIFPFDTYAEPVERSLAQLMNQLDDLGTQVDAFANAPELEAAPRSVAAPLVGQIESMRDQIARALDRMTRLERVDTLRVARALETGEALLIIGPPEQGVAAVDLDALFLSSDALERSGISAAGVIGPRAQELIASGIAELVAPEQPILIMVHGGQPGELLGASQLFTQTVNQLAQRGIDSVEWAAIEQPTQPSLDAIDPLGNRPRVYMVIAIDSTAQTSTSGLSGAKRAEAMGEVVERLVGEGQNLIVSLNPSIFPSAGRTDPLANAIAPLGIVPEPGYPLLHERMGPMGRIADPVTALVPRDGTHPIAQTLNGLNTVMTWAIPMEIEEVAGVEAAPVVQMAGSDEIWGESGWLTLWRRPAQSRQVMPNQPVYAQADDLMRDSWTLGVAAQRTLAGQTQRAVVIGSNGWVGDAILANTEQMVDGRITTRWAGNSALFDASIAWLAGMDDLIGPGTQARPIATIKPLNEKQYSVIRWLLLAGVPGLILVLSMASRLVFG